MAFSYRLGRYGDIPRCIELLRQSPFKIPEIVEADAGSKKPVEPKEYAHFQKMLETLPPREEMVFVVVEETIGQSASILGFAVSFYVRDSFINRISSGNSGPRLWAELARLYTNGTTPILSRKGIGIANAGGGLVGFSPFHIYDMKRFGDPSKLTTNEETLTYFLKITEAFLDAHKGNKHRGFYKEIFHEGQLQYNTNNGYKLKQELSKEGYFLIETTKDYLEKNPGFMLDPIFRYIPPCIRFSDKHRMFLNATLNSNGSINGTSESLRLSHFPDPDKPEKSAGLAPSTITEQRRNITKYASSVLKKKMAFADVMEHVKGNPAELRPFYPSR
jgi:hypothetical protein